MNHVCDSYSACNSVFSEISEFQDLATFCPTNVGQHAAIVCSLEQNSLSIGNQWRARFSWSEQTIKFGIRQSVHDVYIVYTCHVDKQVQNVSGTCTQTESQ